MDELETRMRGVLLQLALISNGRTLAYDSSGSSSEPDWTLVDDHGRAKLAPGDAPHLRFAAMWDRAATEEQRAAALKAAGDELTQIRKSSGDRLAAEPAGARERRIVKDCEGLPAREAAISMRCGIRDIWKARVAAGRDIERGRLPRNGRELGDAERRREITTLTADGLSARQVARALQLSYSTILRIIGRKAR